MSDDKIIEVMAPYFDGAKAEARRWSAELTLQALRDAGYEVVSVEPSQAMLMAGDEIIHLADKLGGTTTPGPIWRAMLSAFTPTPENQ